MVKESTQQETSEQPLDMQDEEINIFSQDQTLKDGFIQ